MPIKKPTSEYYHRNPMKKKWVKETTNKKYKGDPTVRDMKFAILKFKRANLLQNNMRKGDLKAAINKFKVPLINTDSTRVRYSGTKTHRPKSKPPNQKHNMKLRKKRQTKKKTHKMKTRKRS